MIQLCVGARCSQARQKKKEKKQRPKTNKQTKTKPAVVFIVEDTRSV